MKFSTLVNLPKSLYFCLHYFPFKQAIKLPVFVSYDVKLAQMRGGIDIKKSNNRIFIGMGQTAGLGNKTYWQVGEKGKIIFDGGAVIGKGTQIRVNGLLHIGENFYCNANNILLCENEINFGSNCLIGWNVTFMDTDGHKVLDNKQIKKRILNKIIIEDNVWIASETMVLKGTYIKKGCIVAGKSCVNKAFDEKNILICGNNLIKRHNISWEK